MNLSSPFVLFLVFVLVPFSFSSRFRLTTQDQPAKADLRAKPANSFNYFAGRQISIRTVTGLMADWAIMFLASLVISGRDWLLPAAGLGGLALLVLIWTYWRAPADRGISAVCAMLKVLGLLALLACLLEPLWTGQRARPGANLFAVLADNSQGMQIKDRDATQSRGEFLQNFLRHDQGTWQEKLEENFQVRRYLFDARLQSTKDFSELAFDGRASSIGVALRTMAERFKGQPLAGVLLFTDGNATDFTDAVPDLGGLTNVYPVVIGNDQPIKDITVKNVAVSQTTFEDAPVTIQADVTATGYSGSSIIAQLLQIDQTPRRHPAPDLPASLDQNKPAQRATSVSPAKDLKSQPVKSTGAASNESASARSRLASNPEDKVVAEQRLRVPRDSESLAFRFQIRPERTGISFYRFRVSATDELNQFADVKNSTEATVINNSRMLVVDRGRGPYRILYVAGRPNWEYKFLNRAVAEDDQVQLTGLIRVAKREPKFDFRGRPGEASNPLFRGFDRKSEETERYDQPVLIRLYPNEESKLLFEEKLRGGFPKTAEDLYEYHAIVIDDLESEFFTPDQMSLMQKFVSERGGGLLMLGGVDTFQHGRYLHTPIGDMLPVYLDRADDTKPLSNLKLALTPEGWLQPWARLRNNELDERARLDSMRTFDVMNRARDVKPGASVIATVADSQGNQHRALVTQRFGHGRTAALMIGDMWRWGLQDEVQSRDLAKAWRQLMRWLVVDALKRIDLQTETKREEPNQPVALQTRVRDKKFMPLDNGSVMIKVQPIGQTGSFNPSGRSPSNGNDPPALATNVVQLAADAALSEAGLYQASYVPRETGGYHAETIVTDANGAEVGRAEAGWTSDPAAEEFRSLKPNRALLENIARKTGGEVIDINKLDAFVRALPNRQMPIMESWSYPLWHQPGVFLFALVCFVAEWGLRRWKGMA